MPDFMMGLEAGVFYDRFIIVGVYYDYQEYEPADSTYPGCDAAIDVCDVVWRGGSIMHLLSKTELADVIDACWENAEYELMSKEFAKELAADLAADAAYERQREERLEQLNRDKEYFSNIAREFQDEALADNARRRK